MKRGAYIVFDLTITAGAIALAVALWLVRGEAAPNWWLIGLLVAAGIVGEVATIDGDPDEGEQAFSFATTAHLTAAMLLPPGWAALTAGAGSMLGEVVNRQRPLTTMLNGSLATFCTLAGGAAYHAVQSDGPLGIGTYLGVVAMLGAYIPLNLTPPGIVTTIMSPQGLRPWAWLPPADFLAYVMEACLAAAITLIVLESPSFLFFLAPLLVAVFLALKRSRLIAREARNTLRALVTMVDAKDPSTAAHSERVGDLAAELGEAVGLGTTHVRTLRWAGRLHDIGKVAVDDTVLRKTGPLTESEWGAMRRHPAVGAELLESLSLTRAITPAVRYHHERADGAGYYLLAPEAIPLDASILTIVDSFDAMTSDRTYRSAVSFDDALGRIQAGAGTQFHPALAAAFVDMMQGRRVEPLLTEEDGWRGMIKQRVRDARRSRGSADADPVSSSPIARPASR